MRSTQVAVQACFEIKGSRLPPGYIVRLEAGGRLVAQSREDRIIESATGGMLGGGLGAAR